MKSMKTMVIALCAGIVMTGCNNLAKGTAIGAAGGAFLRMDKEKGRRHCPAGGGAHGGEHIDMDLERAAGMSGFCSAFLV